MAKSRVINRTLAEVKVIRHLFGHSGTTNPSGWAGCDHSFSVDDELYGIEIRVGEDKPIFIRTRDPLFSPDLTALALFGAKFVNKKHGFHATKKLELLFEEAVDQHDFKGRMHSLVPR